MILNNVKSDSCAGEFVTHGFDFLLLEATTEAIQTGEMNGKNLYVVYQIYDQMRCEISTINDK